MTERVKLVGEGTSLYMRVQKAELVPVGKYPEYSFIGEIDNGRVVDLRVPKASADRQLGRLELVLADTVGKDFCFSRDANPADAQKPFWGITLTGDSAAKARQGNGANGPSNGGTAATAQPAATTPPAPAAAPSPTEKEKGSTIYKRVTQFVLDDILPQMRAAGIPITHEGTSAQIATLHIAATKNGH